MDTIIARTDGVPLFVEELTKAVLETGEASIPASLHDSLMARLDRVPEVKVVAQIAACIGRQFEFALLASVTERSEPDLQSALDKLAAAELIFRRGTPPDATYTFKHALVRDAAYGSLLKKRRRALHQRIAEALEQHFPAYVETEPEVVARHYSEGGFAEQAFSFWCKAGERATSRSAYREATEFLQRALGALEQLPDDDNNARRALQVRLGLRPAFGALGDYSGVLANLANADALAARLHLARQRVELITDKTHVLYHLGRLDEAIENGRLACGLASEIEDPVVVLPASFNLGQSYFFSGNGQLALDTVLKYTPLLEGEHRHARLGSTGTSACTWFGNIAGAYALLGDFEQALRFADKACQIAGETKQPFDLSMAEGWCGFALIRKGDIGAAIELLEGALKRAETFHLPFLHLWAATLLGAAYRLSGEIQPALELLESALADACKLGLRSFEAWLQTNLAPVCLDAGEVDLALRSIQDWLSAVEKEGYRWFELQLWRSLGRAHVEATAPDWQRGEACLRRSRLPLL